MKAQRKHGGGSVTKKKVLAQKVSRGRPMNLYVHPEDEQRIRDLAGWLAAKGHRVSDSQVVKAALRCAEPNSKFLEAYQSTIVSDQRYKQPDEESKG